jgi:hypothetical protein
VGGVVANVPLFPLSSSLCSSIIGAVVLGAVGTAATVSIAVGSDAAVAIGSSVGTARGVAVAGLRTATSGESGVHGPGGRKGSWFSIALTRVASSASESVDDDATTTTSTVVCWRIDCWIVPIATA